MHIHQIDEHVIGESRFGFSAMFTCWVVKSDRLVETRWILPSYFITIIRNVSEKNETRLDELYLKQLLRLWRENNAVF